mmetsp:Transcript_38979/g.87162  ORF Transcript_38979/g.87162 Transcript_38979/m.87162 type:complete len:321 (+) Transcript_38979:173-1135(+)
MEKQANVVAFLVEWFDNQAAIVRHYRLNHFADGTLEMINLATRQNFLKRMYFPEVSRADFQLGKTVTVNRRQLLVADYADEGTKLYYERAHAKVYGVLPPERMGQVGQTLSAVQAGFTVSRLKSVVLPGRGLGLAMEAGVLHAGDVTEKWDGLAAKHGIEVDGAEACLNAQAAPGLPRCEVTACLVKPHAVKEASLGPILSQILEAGFTIERVEMLHLDPAAATNFFDVYKGVLPHYLESLEHLSDGHAVFVMVSGGGHVVEDFRDLCGPSDVEVAKVLRPKSLRSRFGRDRVKNAVHCTDMPDDGALECTYFAHFLDHF